MKTIFLTFAMVISCYAQSNDCDLHAITDTASPIYPPIAKAAHVNGTIIMIATFEQGGDVQSVRVMSGPKMLEQSAIEYVKGWKANSYSGVRNCPIVINYVLDKPETQTIQLERLDSQHVDVYGQTVCLCDPPAELGKHRKRFWIF